MSDTSSQDAASRSRSSITEIDLMELVRDVWNAKYTIIAAFVLAFFFALFSLAVGKKSYTATTMLGPAESSAQAGGGGGSSLGQLSGAASLLGVNLGGMAGTDFTKFKSILSSENLAAALYNNDTLKPVFFGPSWVPETRSWKRPTALSFEIKDFLKGILGLRQWTTPDPFQVQDTLKLHLGVLTDKVNGYLQVSISGDSPQEALFVLRSIITTADGLIREDVKKRTANRIEYLSTTLQQTTRQDQRDALITVLSTQEKTMMMTSADRLYAIDMIDPPSVNPMPSSPKPSSTVMTDIFTAIILVTLWAVIRGHFLVRGKFRGGKSREPGLDGAVRAWVRRRVLKRH